MVGGSLIPLNSTMVAVALPTIGRDTGVTASRAALLVTAYLVTMLMFQPAGGRTGDLVGSRTIAWWGLVGFGGASLLAALAPTFALLLGARCLQAAFGAACSPNLQAILRRVVAPDRRGRAFGLMGSGIGTGAAIGPIVGGLLVTTGSWRSVFLVNLPVVALALWLLRRSPTGETDAGDGQAHHAAGARVLLRAHFLAACVTQATSNFGLYMLLLLLPVLLAAAQWSSGAIGLAVSALTLGMLALAPVGGRLGDRGDRRLVVVSGMAVATIGCGAVLAGLHDAPLMIIGALIVGCGQGVAGASLQATALESVPAQAAASAAGVYSTSRYVGSIAASLLLAAQNVSDAGSATLVAGATLVAAVLATMSASLLRRP